MGDEPISKHKRELERFDSVFDLPKYIAVEHQPESVRPEGATFDESRIERADSNLVALAVESATLRSQLFAALEHLDVAIAGPEVVSRASLIITAADADVGHQLGELRRAARPDAAIFVISSSASPVLVASAHAAGAFACLRSPLVFEEVRSLVLSALASREARVRAADLARKLDLESHLASIGRMSTGFAHEVSTPLATAELNLDTIERETSRLLELLKSIAFSPSGEVTDRLNSLRREIRSLEEPGGLAGAIKDTMVAHQRLHTLLATMRDLVGHTYELRRETLDVRELAQDVLAWLSEELRDVQVELVGEPAFAQTDRTLLAQVLTNLISNAAHAAKSLPSPRIRLHVYPKAGRIVISVRDNGPGIPLDLQDKVFEPFFTTRRAEGGTGLGLALCREYILQLNADLSLWSLPGRGACFRVELLAANGGVRSHGGT